MNRHPKIYKPCLILIKSRWVIGYHMGTVKGSGSANYFVSGRSKKADRPGYGGCHWLMPEHVKPLKRDFARLNFRL